MPEKQYYVYILASKRNGALYIAVTSELSKRVYQHKNDLMAGFTPEIPGTQPGPSFLGLPMT